MNAWPIIERELRVQARRASTYGVRVLMAGMALVLASRFLVGGASGLSPVQPSGQALLYTVGRAALLLLLGAGLALTSDSLSRERREGTLGLLFLTDLSSRDVLSGKAAASALHIFYSLAAVLPVLGLSLLMGGVTGMEFLRFLLVLFDAAILGLSIGLFASSGVVRQAQALRRGAVWMGLVVLTPLACVSVLYALPAMPASRWPVYVHALSVWGLSEHAKSASYAAEPTAFWVGLSLNALFGRLFLAYAGRGLGRYRKTEQGTERLLVSTVEEEVLSKAGTSTPESSRHMPRMPGLLSRRSKRRPFRAKAYERNPALWLLEEPREILMVIRVLVLLLPLHTLVVNLGRLFPFAFGGWLQTIRNALTSTGGRPVVPVVCQAILDLLVAWVAARFFVQLRRREVLELVLTTPLTGSELLSAHWTSLRRWLLVPLGLLVVFSVVSFSAVLLGLSVVDPGGFDWLPALVWYTVFMLTIWPLHFLCLVMVATRLSLKARNTLWAATLSYALCSAWDWIWAWVIIPRLPGIWPARLDLPRIIVLLVILWGLIKWARRGWRGDLKMKLSEAVLPG